jgi:hypothetical protein
MRKLIFALAAFGALAAINSAPAAAQDYPFCIKGRDYPGNGDCRFPTYASCMATAAGLFAYCDRNPFLMVQPGNYAPKPHRRRVHRDVY